MSLSSLTPYYVCHDYRLIEFVSPHLRTEKRFKLILLLLVTMSTALAFWFAASVYGYTSNNPINLFLTLCFQYFFALSTTSIFLEAAVEVTYPIPEGIVQSVQAIAICACYHHFNPQVLVLVY